MEPAPPYKERGYGVHYGASASVCLEYDVAGGAGRVPVAEKAGLNTAQEGPCMARSVAMQGPFYTAGILVLKFRFNQPVRIAFPFINYVDFFRVGV